jgi:hypothetical protein
MTVSRSEIAGLVGPSLTRGSHSNAEILAFAVDAGARPAVVDALRGMRNRSYSGLRSLWAEFPDMPIDA